MDIRHSNESIKNGKIGSDFHLIISCNVLNAANPEISLDILSNSLSKGGFIILQEEANIDINNDVLQQFGLILISKQRINKKQYILLRGKEPSLTPEIIDITEKNFIWVQNLKNAMKNAIENGIELLIVGQNEPDLGTPITFVF